MVYAGQFEEPATVHRLSAATPARPAKLWRPADRGAGPLEIPPASPEQKRRMSSGPGLRGRKTH